MGSVIFVAGIFILLGLSCALCPEKIAELGVRLDSVNQRRSRAMLFRYARLTRWTGRIVGVILLGVGVLLLFVSWQ